MYQVVLPWSRGPWQHLIVAVAILRETVTAIVSVAILPHGVTSKQRAHHEVSDV